MTIKDTPKGLPDSALDFPREVDDDVVGYMEKKYPEMTKEFRQIQREQYELFLRKQHDYGPQNVAVGSLLKTKEDIKLSLLGLWFRIQDKTERIKTLLMRDDGNSVQDEPVVDSYNDISVYGIMAQVVSRGKWAK
jgi:hypothetical protein|tara:strand:+ start:434 stop:838 length:405 start_codon:yes stop_codon:yes gene_type:complete